MFFSDSNPQCVLIFNCYYKPICYVFSIKKKSRVSITDSTVKQLYKSWHAIHYFFLQIHPSGFEYICMKHSFNSFFFTSLYLFNSCSSLFKCIPYLLNPLIYQSKLANTFDCFLHRNEKIAFYWNVNNYIIWAEWRAR